MRTLTLTFICLTAINNLSFSQSTNGSGANVYFTNRFLGWDASNLTNPLTIRTNNITRMHINGIATGFGVSTSGFIGIGTTLPASPLHIQGSGNQTAVGWSRGITLSNSAAIVWEGGGGQGFMMAHPSSSPNGNFYAGAVSSLNSSAGVNYAYSVYVNAPIGTNPLLSTQFYKNVLIQQDGVDRRLGVNTTDPTAIADINGDMRIRDVQLVVPDALFVGSRFGGDPNDLNVRRLDFTGNPNDVLLGNGTFGPAPGTTPVINANNGVTYTGTFVQLGEPYNIFSTVPLLNNREVRLNGNNFIFSGNNGSVGIGLNAPQLPSERLDVSGNARFRNVPVQGGQSLILGLQNGLNANDIELSRLVFPANPNVFLAGNGTWQAGVPGPTGANWTNRTDRTNGACRASWSTRTFGGNSGSSERSKYFGCNERLR